eukprot:g4256.t1
MLTRSARSVGPAAVQFAEWVAPMLSEPPCCAIERFEGGRGLGLVAAQDVAAGDAVLVVPKDVWLPTSAPYARAQALRGAPHFVDRVSTLARRAVGLADGGGAGVAEQALRENVSAIVGTAAAGGAGARTGAAERGAQNLEASILLAMHLLFEMADAHSPLQPYLEFVLPAVRGAVAASPLCWALTPEHADCARRLDALAGTRALATARRRAAAVRGMHAALFGGGGGEQAPREGEGEGAAGGPTLAQFTLALTAILSRAVSHQGTLFTLVPVLDLLNHNPEPSCKHELDASHSFVVRALRAHRAGEELCLFYHDHGNDALLRLYGFALPGNPHDAVPLPQPEWAREPPAPLRAPPLLRAADCPGAEPGSESEGGGGGGAVGLGAGPVGADVVEEMLSQTAGASDALGRLRRPIEAALGEYAGGAGMQADRALLQAGVREEAGAAGGGPVSAGPGPQLEDWERSCVALRLGEKEILHAALRQLHHLEARMS